MARSLVIDHLQKSQKDERVALAYYYFDYHDQEQLLPLNFILSLLKQLLTPKSRHVPIFSNIHEQFLQHGNLPTFNELVATFELLCNELQTTYMVIDALDECETREHREVVLGFLERLSQNASKIKIFVTSRLHSIDIRGASSPSPNWSQITIKAEERDIQTYLLNRISRNREMTQLLDSLLNEEVVGKVGSSSRGC